MDSAEGIALQVKYEWAERRREEAEMLNVSLRSSIMSLLDEISTLTDRCTTLKNVQEIIIAERDSADRTIEKILKEKTNLAAENASLRMNQKDLRRSIESLTLANTILSQVVPEGGDSRRETASSESELQQAKLGLFASRLLLAKLLGIVHRHGIHISIEDLTSDIPDILDSADAEELDISRLVLQEAQRHIPPTPFQPAEKAGPPETEAPSESKAVPQDSTRKSLDFSDSDPSTDSDVGEERSALNSARDGSHHSASTPSTLSSSSTITSNAKLSSGSTITGVPGSPQEVQESSNIPVHMSSEEKTIAEEAPKSLFYGLWNVLIGGHDVIVADDAQAEASPHAVEGDA